MAEARTYETKQHHKHSLLSHEVVYGNKSFKDTTFISHYIIV